ncbi:hypothetical protein [Roseobacter sp.]|uniref:hypothetical protein n=1 Tax=Roseobacter sp. TaxID=1907202 RepID=UPI00329A5262
MASPFNYFLPVGLADLLTEKLRNRVDAVNWKFEKYFNPREITIQRKKGRTDQRHGQSNREDARRDKDIDADRTD